MFTGRGEVRANVRRHIGCDHSTAAPAQAFGTNSRNHGILFRMPALFTGFDPLEITSSKQCAEKSTTTCYTSRTTKPFEVDEDSAVPVQAAAAASILDSKSAGWFDAFWRFTRPHTIIGSVSQCPPHRCPISSLYYSSRLNQDRCFRILFASVWI